MKGFAPAPRQPDILPRLLMAMSLAFWLMLGPVAAQPPAHTLKRPAVQSDRADLEAQEKIDAAFKAFEGLLDISKRADAMNDHFRVRQASWHEAQEAWEKSSATLPPPVKALKRCAIPLFAARKMIERADSLFRQARDSSDPMRGSELLVRHQRLLTQAEDRLQQAERCYLTTRNAYLKGRKAEAPSQVRTFGRP